MLEKAGGYKKGRGGSHTPDLRTAEEVVTAGACFIPQTKHASFSEDEGGGRKASTNPTFI